MTPRIPGIRALFHRFRQDQRGSLSLEAVIIMPLLFWVYTAMFVFWDAYKTQSVNLKASYTIADMLSRQLSNVDGAWLNGATSVYAYLSAGSHNHRLRVTVVSLRVINEDGDTSHQLEWSEGTGGMTGYCSFAEVPDVVPIIAPGDHLIIVETESDWIPTFRWLLNDYTMTETVVTSPRFGDTVRFDGSGGCGTPVDVTG